MTVKDILAVDFDDLIFLNESELRGMLNTLNAAARKRVSRLRKAGLEEFSPALAAYGAKGFSAAPKGSDTGELLQRIANARAYLSVRGDMSRAAEIKAIAEAASKAGATWREIMDWIYAQPRLSYYADSLGSPVISRIAYNAAVEGWSKDDVVAAIMSAYNDYQREMTDNNAYYDAVMSSGHDTDYGEFLDEFDF